MTRETEMHADFQKTLLKVWCEQPILQNLCQANSAKSVPGLLLSITEANDKKAKVQKLILK